jgi:dimethylhistidine N-methyltransferase
VGDFTDEITLPAAIGDAPRVGFFPGSTIGNFTPREAVALLQKMRRMLGAGSGLLIGFDLVKGERELVSAYDDAQGVTAAFNLNLLTRMNRELDGDFDLSAFAHRAVWNPLESRMEMHLVSLADQEVGVAGRRFAFKAGETIHTENSYKFSLDGFAALAVQAGWRPESRWVSADPAFAMVLLRAAET